MKINRLNLFAIIVTFLIIIDLLIGLDLNKFYIRAILSFFFITIVPGLLIMLVTKVREVRFWEYLTYTVGLSISFIMFAGLAVNWILPWLNITDKPLSLWPILISFNILFVILGLFAFIRNKDLNFKLNFPKLNLIDNIFFIIPMFFPVMSVLGAFILNDNGSNTLTIIMLVSVALYFILAILFRDKLNENVYPWAIFFMSIALIFAVSLRSLFVSGIDFNIEYQIFESTKDSLIWTIKDITNTYSAMLSVTILPSILSIFVKINPHLIIKLLISSIFCLIPLIILLISRKILSMPFAFIASFFFVSQSAFANWAWIPLRQETALLFFSLIILSLVSDLSKENKNKAILIFGLSMIVSHYSTTYIAIVIMLTTYLVSKSGLLYRGKNHLKNIDLSLRTIIVLFIFCFLWYSQLTTTSTDVVDFAYKSVSNVLNMFNEDVQAKGQTPFSQFNIFSKKNDYSSELKNYINSTENISESYRKLGISYPKETYGRYQVAPIVLSKYNYGSNIVNIVLLSREAIKLIGEILITIGIFFIFIKRNSLKINANYLTISVVCFFILVGLTLAPFITIKYDLVRTFAQILIVISGAAVIGGFYALNFLNAKLKLFIIMSFFILYFLFFSGIVNQIIGGPEISLKLNNEGLDYNVYYVHKSEIVSSDWILDIIKDTKENLHLDYRSYSKIILSQKFKTNTYYMNIGLTPNMISRRGYVYASNANNINKMTFISYRGNMLYFKFPEDFLNQNKNKIYSNKYSVIYR